MKQQQETSAATLKPECKPVSAGAMSNPATLSRHKVISKPKESPRTEARPKTVPLDVKDGGLKSIRRPLLANKPKSGEQAAAGSQKGNRDAVRVVEQFARPKRGTVGLRTSDEGALEEKKKNTELRERLDLSEALVKDLQAEVLSLKTELDKVRTSNRKLSDDLAAAQAKIAAFSSREQGQSCGEYQSPKFRDIQKLIANKLEHPKAKRLVKTPPSSAACSSLKAADADRTAPTPPISSLPPAPPPPPPPRPPAKAATILRTPPLLQLHLSLTKQGGRKEPPAIAGGNRNKPTVNSVHNSIVDEIQNRSAHLLAIKADIETKGEFINGLIQKVLTADYTDIEDVLKFVDWLDSKLSSLADERAVLKHFKWPERKADALREAAVEYRDLKLLENEISFYKDDPSIPCGAALKKMAVLLDKSERSTKRLIQLRNSVMRSYQDFKIPVDWMLDSGIMSKIKQASMKLATLYIKRVSTELEFTRSSDRESTQEALLLQGMHFAYRAHQFAGGFDSETLCAFEEIKQRVPSHLVGGSKELFAGIPL